MLNLLSAKKRKTVMMRIVVKLSKVLALEML